MQDLQDNQVALAARRDYYGQAFTFAETALAGMQATGPVTDSEAWDIVLAAYQAGQIWLYRLTGPTYREAQNAGALKLVGNPLTLKALAEFYDISAFDYDLVAGALPRYRELVRERTPWPIQRHIWSHDCEENFKTAINDGVELRRCDGPADTELVQQTAAAFRSDHELQKALLGRMAQLTITVVSNDRRVNHAQEVLDMMGAPAQAKLD